MICIHVTGYTCFLCDKINDDDSELLLLLLLPALRVLRCLQVQDSLLAFVVQAMAMKGVEVQCFCCKLTQCNLSPQ